jgi:hypothetical protein
VVECFKLDPLALRDDPSSDADESLDTRDTADPRGVNPERCDVTYGLRLLEDRRGRGEYGRLPGCDEGAEPPSLACNRSSHIVISDARSDYERE